MELSAGRTLGQVEEGAGYQEGHGVDQRHCHPLHIEAVDDLVSDSPAVSVPPGREAVQGQTGGHGLRQAGVLYPALASSDCEDSVTRLGLHLAPLHVNLQGLVILVDVHSLGSGLRLEGV